jgi:fructose-1-phosphate kinase PfkB-like protein
MVLPGAVGVVGLVQEALYKTGLASLRSLCVEESEEVVVVSGSVPSYYCKQVAQETVLAAAGGRRVVIRISVHPPSSAPLPNEP